MVNDFEYSKLSAPDVVRRFLQKCRFALRKALFYPLNYGNVSISDCRFRIESLLIPVFDTESFRVLATAVGVADCKSRAGPSGNRDPETGITPMDNFICWGCEHHGLGAFMLMGRPAEKWLVKRQRQMELELAPRQGCL